MMCLLITLALAAGSAFGGLLDFSATPAAPTYADAIAIEIRNCAQGGVLHWGVNARGNNWRQAIPEYRPAGSVEDGVATRTPLSGPDSQGVCRVTLGPFDLTNQPVASVDFAVQWADGSWETAGGDDYHIPVTQARIAVEPADPDAATPVRVIVRRSRPGGQLRWGVNAGYGVWRPPHRCYQPPGTVPSDDGLAVDSPLPPPDAAGNSAIGLGPFNRPEQVVTTLHMAVHWGDDWDTDLGRNYNVPIRLDAAADVPGVCFRAPADGDTVGDVVTVRVDVVRADSATLWIDGVPRVSLIEPPFAVELAVRDLPLGPHQLVAHVGDGGTASVSAVNIWRAPRVERAAAPEGARPGARIEGSNVTFVLFAPGKRFVSVVGDFNEWDSLANVMNLSPDGTWWLARPLPPGRHLYQYAVDGVLKMADPYATDIEWKDAEGAEGFRPEEAKSVIEVGAPPFAWTDGAFRRPAREDTIIYEVSIDDFCPGGGFTGFAARLDYVRDLGVTAIEPLPVTEFAGAWSWGYNPSYHFAPETVYGTPGDLKGLVDAAHGHGIGFLVDMVLNHMDGNSALHVLYGRDYSASPYFRLFLGENWGFPDLDQESDAFKRYAADVVGFWIREFHADGFRYDATRWVGWQGYNDWGAGWFAYAAKQADSNTLQIAEHLPSDPELIWRTEMDTGWHDYFRWRIRDMLRAGALDRREFERVMDARRIGFSNSFDRLVYVESHDEERVRRELVDAGYAEEESWRRALTALALVMTAPGVPMIYAGQEFGETAPKALAPNPLDWSKQQSPAGRRHHELSRMLIRLRARHPALRTEHIRFTAAPAEVAVYERGLPSEAVVVAVNFARASAECGLVFPAPGDWVEILGECDIRAWGESSASIVLPAGAAAVWVCSPEPGAASGL